jgi:hypothetical protein
VYENKRLILFSGLVVESKGVSLDFSVRSKGENAVRGGGMRKE